MGLKQIYRILFLVLLSTSAFQEPASGRKAKKAGDLALFIVASDTPEYINEWLNTPSNHAVTIKPLRIAKPDQLIVAAFLVTGMTANSEGNYDFSVSLCVLDPDLKTIFCKRNFAKGKGVLPGKPMFVMADPALDIILENSDKEGLYTIVAQVHDLVTGKKSNNSHTIEFIKNE